MSREVPASLSIQLFGNMEVRIAGVSLKGLHQREGGRLLAFLTLHHGRSISYRTLAETFFPAEARQNLEYNSSDYHSTRQAIYHLRRALDTEAYRLSNPGKGYVRLDLSSAEVDYVAFERLSDQRDPDAWREAIALHRSPLLQGWTESWVQIARHNTERTLHQLQQWLVATVKQTPEVTLPEATPHPENQESVPFLEVEEGVVPLGSPYYIDRPVDVQFTTSLERRDGIVLLKGTKQSGKTSLLARGLQRARDAGARVVLTDLQRLNASDLESANSLAMALADMIADQLELDVLPSDVWNERRGANINLDRFLRRETLAKIEAPVLWALDEVDLLFAYPYCNELFGLFRSWHNERSLNPGAPWSRLTLVMVYATEAHLFISDLNQSPFNVGTRLSLHDFTPEQVGELNQRYGAPLRSPAEKQRFYTLVNGHPYLAHRGIAEMAAKRLSLDTLESIERIYSGHLRRLLDRLLQDGELTDVLRRIARGETCSSERAFYRLRSAGLLRGEHREEAQWRCQIYQSYFVRALL